MTVPTGQPFSLLGFGFLLHSENLHCLQAGAIVGSTTQRGAPDTIHWRGHGLTHFLLQRGSGTLRLQDSVTAARVRFATFRRISYRLDTRNAGSRGRFLVGRDRRLRACRLQTRRDLPCYCPPAACSICVGSPAITALPPRSSPTLHRYLLPTLLCFAPVSNLPAGWRYGTHLFHLLHRHYSLVTCPASLPACPSTGTV